MYPTLFLTIIQSIYGRAYHLSNESYLQQTNAICEWGNDMQVKCWWHSTGREMSILSTGDFEKVDEHNFDTLDLNTKAFLKAVKTSCQSVGHSEEAAKYARRKCFAMAVGFFWTKQFVYYYNTRWWVQFQSETVRQTSKLGECTKFYQKYLDPDYFINHFTCTKTFPLMY